MPEFKHDVAKSIVYTAEEGSSRGQVILVIKLSDKPAGGFCDYLHMVINEIGHNRGSHCTDMALKHNEIHQHKS